MCDMRQVNLRVSISPSVNQSIIIIPNPQSYLVRIQLIHVKYMVDRHVMKYSMNFSFKDKNESV